MAGKKERGPGPERGRKLGFLSHLLLPSTEELRLGGAGGAAPALPLRPGNPGPQRVLPPDPGGWGRSPSSFGPGGPGPHPSSSDSGVWTPSPSSSDPGVRTLRRSSPTQNCSPPPNAYTATPYQLHVKKGGWARPGLRRSWPRATGDLRLWPPHSDTCLPQLGLAPVPACPTPPPKAGQAPENICGMDVQGPAQVTEGALKSLRGPSGGSTRRAGRRGEESHSRPARLRPPAAGTRAESQPSPPRLPAEDTPPSPSRPPGAAKLALQVWLRPPPPLVPPGSLT